MTILITGGFGFIGSAVVRRLLTTTEEVVVNVDLMTYAASPAALGMHAGDRRHIHIQADICDHEAMREAFATHRPDRVMHLAAESHVDRSIDGPAAFIRTNVVGTQVLLEAARHHWNTLDAAAKAAFRFHHVSTDEVFGSLHEGDAPFDARTPYDPRSPYSASKAGSDHLVRAWEHTYGFPAFVSNTTNNYGPWQFPEKLIPLVTLNALEGRPLPVYGKGENIRDWLHVDDHAEALVLALMRGRPGATYCIGPRQERTNLQVVRAICATLDRLRPDPAGPRERLITYVADRPGHDFRYAMDPSEAEAELGWTARYDFEAGLEHTIRWYLDNEAWWRPIRDKTYGGQRLGVKA
ncbi:dTDP-glucose 4,6-dehydratase [Falsiroseomonas selenitidurans]|uniref:dTDP-glucose 4,6-dehydratase n=1 Tax=Falsiroseomonas selenitidurans TaxID=2716335 RepID=A0ABX1E4F8_9PROT|nr:dTDP-glucose 4,6-dehydratase [Falsiroseomonas selenitidurans]NKC32072.1 dTDP-glucose 4,6-dehydratase [Falsiroseomonas selenitidurans]